MKWVDIDKEVPKEECEVLITLRYIREEKPFIRIKNVVTTALYHPEKHKWWFDMPEDYNSHYWDYANITAWCPYPEPYRGVLRELLKIKE